MNLYNIVFRLIGATIALAITPIVSAQTVRYVHTDSLGSVIAVTDANRNVIERRDYDPYGATVGGGGREGPAYSGHVNDVSTGLTYMQQRYYDPAVGLFLSADPVTPHANPVAQFHRYRYANNNPYKFIDPDGRSVWTKLAKFIVKGGDVAQTTAGLVEDFETASDSSNSFGTRLLATASMASEILPVSIGDVKDGVKVASKVADAVGDGAKKSPDISPRDIAGRTPEEIDGIAKDSGLIPRGPDPSAGRGAYVDPVNGNQRVLVHPDADCGPHCHVNDASGQRLDIDGNVVSPESPEAHLPLRVERRDET